MKFHAIGLGGAGCRIANHLAERYGSERFCTGIVGFDTDAEELAQATSIDPENRHRIGDEAGGTGLGGNLDAGFEIGTDHSSEMSRAIDQTQPSSAEAFVLICGLGGATGGGFAPALGSALKTITDVPVYALCTLPAASETDAVAEGELGIHRPNVASNTQRALDRLDGVVDAFICFDNNRWLKTDQRLVAHEDRLNGTIVDRVTSLFGAGESDDELPTAQQIIDASDITRALGNSGDIATIGYAEQTVEVDRGSRFGLGLFGSKEPEPVDTSKAVSAIETVIRKAARGKQTVEPTNGRAERTLLVVGGPPSWLNRQAIAQGRKWLTEEVGSGALLHGDAPDPEADAVYAVVLRSGIEPDNWLLKTDTGL